MHNKKKIIIITTNKITIRNTHIHGKYTQNNKTQHNKTQIDQQIDR